MYCAALIGSSKLVEAMLEKGRDVNVEWGELGKPLMLAAYKLDIDLVKLLLKRGADVNFSTVYLGTAL